MDKLKFKRFTAYLIDILIVSFSIMLLSNIKLINPQHDKYNKVYDEYREYVTNFDIGNVDTNTLNDSEYLEMVHDLSYYGLSYSCTEFLIILLYFSIVPLLLKNQTIGKKIMKLEVVPLNNKKSLGFLNYFLRSLTIPIWSNILLYTNLYNFLAILMVVLTKDKIFLYGTSILSILFCVFSYADVVVCLVNKDHISLHDRISGTKVVDK